MLLFAMHAATWAELLAPDEVEHVGTTVKTGRSSTLPIALNLHKVPNDGDSLFNAVALALALEDASIKPMKKRDAMSERAPRLREQSVDLLCYNGPASLKAMTIADVAVWPIVEANLRKLDGGENEPLSSYCARMRAPGEHGSLAELLAMTKVLARPIRLSTPDGTESHGVASAASKALSLLRGDDGHFQVISDVPNPEMASVSAAESARAKVAAAKDRAQRKVEARQETRARTAEREL